MDVCIAPLAEGDSEELSAWQAGEKKSSNYAGTQMICPVASHSGVQEEYHSKVQDPQLQMPGSGIEKLFFNWEGFGVIALWRSLENEPRSEPLGTQPDSGRGCEEWQVA